MRQAIKHAVADALIGVVTGMIILAGAWVVWQYIARTPNADDFLMARKEICEARGGNALGTKDDTCYNRDTGQEYGIVTRRQTIIYIQEGKLNGTQ